MVEIYKPKCPECGKRSLVFRDRNNIFKCENCGVIIDLDMMPSWAKI